MDASECDANQKTGHTINYWRYYNETIGTRNRRWGGEVGKKEDKVSMEFNGRAGVFVYEEGACFFGGQAGPFRLLLCLHCVFTSH